MNYEELSALLKEGTSQRGIAEYFQVSQTTVRYWMRKYGLTTNNPRSSQPLVSDELLLETVRISASFSEVLRTLGIKLSGKNHSYWKKRATRLGATYDHFWVRRNQPSKTKKPASHYLVHREGGHKVRTETLRRCLIEVGVPHQCSIERCRLTGEWLNQPLVLQIDHIDGNPWNNEPSNLRFLCPNCHSQTATYGNKIR